MEFVQVAQTGGFALLGTALSLGLRHGIDWDHIAAITDITTTATGHDAVSHPGRLGWMDWRALGLASLYALGHASVVAILGAAALFFGALLPDWVDPIVERIVGITLVVLGLCVFYSLAGYLRGGGEFRLRSRWMLLFAGTRRVWHGLQHRVAGIHHDKAPSIDQYGPKTAFGVGVIHGIGAETGSQVLLIAAVGGAASQGFGTAMMVAFIVGLLLSNTLVAGLSAAGFMSSKRARGVYITAGVLAGVFSLAVGLLILTGWAAVLPDLPGLLGAD